MAGLPIVATKCSRHAQLAYVVMALVALDQDHGKLQAGLYFGGHVRILAALGQLPTDTRTRAMRRAIQELTDLGIVTLASRAVPGRHAVYRINVDLEAVDNSTDDGLPEDRMEDV